jgi:hypothetical protein
MVIFKFLSGNCFFEILQNLIVLREAEDRYSPNTFANSLSELLMALTREIILKKICINKHN